MKPRRAGSSRAAWRLVLGVVVSAGFMAGALWGVEWASIGRTLWRVQLQHFAVACAIGVALQLLRAWRWRVMLLPAVRRAEGAPPLSWNVASATLIGALANNVLPARLGELVRAYALRRSAGVAASASLATLVYERVLDVFSVLLLAGVTLAFAPRSAWLATGGAVVLALNTALLVVLVLMVRYDATVDRLIVRLTRRFAPPVRMRARAIVGAFIGGLSVVRDARAQLGLALWSAVMILLAAVSMYFCLLAVGLDELPLSASATLTVVVSLGAMIPSAPANVGTIQFACIVALGIYGIERSTGLAYSVVYHASQFFPITAAGLFCLWRETFSLRELTAKAAVAREPAVEPAEDPVARE